MSRNPAARPAYTLLEVLLATAIGVLLLGALYVALDVQLTSAQAGRDVVERSTLARSLLTRMAADVGPSLGNMDPARYRTKKKSSSSGGSSTALSSSSTGSSGATGSTASTSTTSSTGGTSSGTATASAEDQANTTQNTTIRFMWGVQGDNRSLTLYVSRLPREVYAVRPEDDNPESRTIVSDLRRITYWLAGDADSPLGLARQEIKVATSDSASGAASPETADEGSQVIAEEVKDVQFSYFDGTAWAESWDGSIMGSDGVTPIGPPRAIAIVIGIPKVGTAELQYYRHVIAVPAANGMTTQDSTQATTP